MSDVYRPTWTGDEKQDRENEAIAQALAQKTKVPIWNKAPERFPYGEIFIAPGAPAFDPGQGPGLYYGSSSGTYARLDVLGNTLLGVYDQTTDAPTIVCSPDPQVVLAGDYWICTANGACISACANINGLVAGPGDQIVWSGTAWELIAVSGSYLSSQIDDTANGHITLAAGGTSNTAPTLANHLARKAEVDAAIAQSDAADQAQDTRLDDLETNKLDTSAALQVFSFAAYLSLDAPDDTPLPNLGAAWQDLDMLTVEQVTPRYITNLGSGRFTFQAKGVYCLSLSGSVEHNESNQGRITYYRLYNYTEGTGAPGVIIPTGRNAAASTIAGMGLFEIADGDIGDEYGVQIGNGDTYTAVNIQTLTLSAFSVGEWREII